MEPFNFVFPEIKVENALNKSGDGFSGPFADVLRHYSKTIFGPIQINWFNGGEKGSCDQGSICSSFFFRTIQSGLYDLGFTPLELHLFNGLPLNITISPIIDDVAAIFLNLYTEKSFRSAHPGVLTSLKTVKANLYILISILCIVASTIYHVRNKAGYFPYEITTLESRCSRYWLLRWLITIINGKFGLYILISIYFSIHSILLILSASITTNYSITLMAPPIHTFEDLIQSKLKAGITEDLNCFKKIDKDILAKHFKIMRAVPKFINENLNEEQAVIFETDEFALSEAMYFCNLMVQTKKTDKFNIIVGNQRYFNTLLAIIYSSNVDEWKREFIIRRSYSCLEMGLCQDASFNALDEAYHRGFLKVTHSAECIKFQQRQTKSSNFQSIKFINIYDVLYLFECLVGFCSLTFFVEICKFK